MDISELEDRISALENNVGGHESDGLRTDIQLIGEALGIIRNILNDLVDTENVDTAEIRDDLERLTTIEHLTRFSY